MPSYMASILSVYSFHTWDSAAKSSSVNVMLGKGDTP